MTRKNGIDIFRLLAAFLVIILHSDFGNINPKLIDQIRLISRWAVPFFFITSGYFLGIKIKNKKFNLDIIQKSLNSLITALAIASIIYFSGQINNQNIFFSIINFITGTYFHLWFIGSMIFGYLTLWFFYYNKLESYLPYLSAALLVLAFLANSYDVLFNIDLDYSLGQFLLSIPFMYLGIYFSGLNLDSKTNTFLAVLLLFGITLQVLEAEVFFKVFNFEKKNHQFLIGTLFISISLFIYSIKIKLPENRFSILGREYSFFIYLYHLISYRILESTLKFFFVDVPNLIKLLFPVYCFIFTLAIATFLKRYFKRLFNLLTGNS